MNKLLKGISFNFKGVSYLFGNKDLWKFVVIPTIINLVLLIVLIGLYTSYFSDIFAYITASLGNLDIQDPQTIWLQIADGLFWVLRLILQIIFFFLSLIIIFVIVFFISTLVNSPFYEGLADRIINIELKKEDEAFKIKTFARNIAHSVKIELYKFFLFIGITISLFVLSWLPAVGFIFMILAYVFSAWVFAFSLSTYPMMTKREKFPKMLAWGKKNASEMIGLGLPATIPIVGMFILPFQVAGGTLLYLELENNEIL